MQDRVIEGIVKLVAVATCARLWEDRTTFLEFMKDVSVTLMTRSKTSLTLLEQAKAGEESAWRELQSLYTPLGYYWCRQSGLSPRDAEEVWANVLGRLAEKLTQFEHNGRQGAFRKWLKTITRNEIVNFRRTRGEEVDGQRVIEQRADENSEDDDSRREVAILYRRAWEMIGEEFSADHAAIFRRVVEEGESPQEVAQQLGLRRASIYTILFRIRERLRERFGEELEEP